MGIGHRVKSINNPYMRVRILKQYVVVEKNVLFRPAMGGVILRLGTLPELWESENTSEDLRCS